MQSYKIFDSFNKQLFVFQYFSIANMNSASSAKSAIEKRRPRRQYIIQIGWKQGKLIKKQTCVVLELFGNKFQDI